MKILLYNIGYGSGLNGSFQDYLLKFWYYLYSPRKVLKNIAKLLKKTEADVVCLLEADAGSLRSRFKSQLPVISDHPNIYSSCKYSPDSIWTKLPIFNKQHNAVCSKEKGKIKYHYLKNGMKRLVLEYIVDDISIFVVHLSLFSKTSRQRQMDGLGGFLKSCSRPYVICGDFNVKGLQEVDELIHQNNLELVKTGATFPAFKPKKHLDLMMVSADIKVKSAGVLEQSFSDHLAVWMEIRNDVK